MTPAAALSSTALDRFEDELLAGGIATRVLERWCGGRVHAEVDRTAPPLPPPADLAGPIAYRRTRLVGGGRLLSQADLWYRPALLDATMIAALAGDAPFGVVIAPLGPRRRTLSVERLAGDPVLAVRALVLASDDTPLAAVDERYRAAVLDAGPPPRVGR